MTKQLNDLAEEVERTSQRVMDLFDLLYLTNHPVHWRVIHQAMKPTLAELNQLSEELTDQVKEMETQKVKRIIPPISIFVIVLMLLLVGSAVAQDVPLDTPTPDVIEGTATLVESTAIAPTEDVTPIVVTLVPDEPPIETPVIVDQTGFRVGIFGFIFFAASLLLGGAGIGVVWSNIRHSKDAKDKLELAYESTSPKTQDEIRRGYEMAEQAWNRLDQFARGLLTLFGEVTDKLPNMEGIPTTPIPPDVAAAIRQAAAGHPPQPPVITPGNQPRFDPSGGEPQG